MYCQVIDTVLKSQCELCVAFLQDSVIVNLEPETCLANRETQTHEDSLREAAMMAEPRPSDNTPNQVVDADNGDEDNDVEENDRSEVRMEGSINAAFSSNSDENDNGAVSKKTKKKKRRNNVV